MDPVCDRQCLRPQRCLGIAGASEDQMNARIVDELHSVDDDVISLLRMEARDAADNEGIAWDAQPFPNQLPPRTGVPD
jgi:hypothetical protein